VDAILKMENVFVRADYYLASLRSLFPFCFIPKTSVGCLFRFKFVEKKLNLGLSLSQLFKKTNDSSLSTRRLPNISQNLASLAFLLVCFLCQVVVFKF